MCHKLWQVLVEQTITRLKQGPIQSSTDHEQKERTLKRMHHRRHGRSRWEKILCDVEDFIQNIPTTWPVTTLRTGPRPHHSVSSTWLIPTALQISRMPCRRHHRRVRRRNGGYLASITQTSPEARNTSQKPTKLYITIVSRLRSVADVEEQLSHISNLSTMLGSIRKPYLNVDSRRRHHGSTSRTLDLTGDQQSWSSIQQLSNEERDQIDLQARLILSRCADRVKEMEALEKRTRLAAFYLNPAHLLFFSRSH